MFSCFLDLGLNIANVENVQTMAPNPMNSYVNGIQAIVFHFHFEIWTVIIYIL